MSFIYNILIKMIANTEGLVSKLGKLQWGKQRNQDFVGGLTALDNLLFCAHALCHDYLTETFLLVSCQQSIPIVILRTVKAK